MSNAIVRNIAIIVWALNGGGAERIAGLLSKELSRSYNVYLFLLDTENIVYEYGGVIVDIGHSGSFYEYDISVNKKKYHIDCAISFLEKMNFANIRTRGTERVIISERSIQSLAQPEHTSETLQIQRYYDNADKVIACSEGVKYELQHHYHVHSDISTIYNFIDKADILEKSYEAVPGEVSAFLGGADFMVNVGRLHPQKNQKRLLLQFSYFHEVNPSVKLLVIGSGKLETELEAYIAELGLKDSIRIIPYTDNPFMYMARAKALILSSRYEGLPNVILEAMTLGCPVIATDCLAGPRELLKGEPDYGRTLDGLELCDRGIIVCNDETEDDGGTMYMAEAMALLCSSETMAEGFRQSGMAYMEQYTNLQILEKWTEVINEGGQRKKNESLKREEELLEAAKYIVIYGAGYMGKSIFLRLSRRYKVDCFVVSRKKRGEDMCLGIPVREKGELDYPPGDTAVILGVGYEQDIVANGLLEYGYTNIVFPYIEPLSYTFYANCRDLNVKTELQDLYRLRTGEDIDIDHPRTFNQKMQWMKLYDNPPIKTELSDKYAVRKYVAKQIGEQYLVPLLGVWDSFDQIDFSKLPGKFVLKCTHGSGMNLLIKDKSQFDIKMAKIRFEEWMQMNYAYAGFEMNYANIKPKIIAERMLEMKNGAEDIPDYKLMCFHGKVRCSFVCSERFSPDGLKVTFYDTDWKVMPFERHYPRSRYPSSKPENYDKMVELAEKLADGQRFVRVDFYEVNGKIYFGELTFYPGSGVEEFTPVEWDKKLGDWICLD